MLNQRFLWPYNIRNDCVRSICGNVYDFSLLCLLLLCPILWSRMDGFSRTSITKYCDYAPLCVWLSFELLFLHSVQLVQPMKNNIILPFRIFRPGLHLPLFHPICSHCEEFVAFTANRCEKSSHSKGEKSQINSVRSVGCVHQRQPRTEA